MAEHEHHASGTPLQPLNGKGWQFPCPNCDEQVFIYLPEDQSTPLLMGVLEPEEDDEVPDDEKPSAFDLALEDLVHRLTETVDVMVNDQGLGANDVVARITAALESA